MQLKIFQIFDNSVIDDLIRIFGQENVIQFKNSSVVGIKYDYSTNKLRDIMKKIPFKQMQQFILSPKLFLELVSKATIKGKKTNIKLDQELDDEQEAFEEIMDRYRRQPSEENFKLLKEELKRLEEEYLILPREFSCLSNGERIVFQSNGILMVSQDALDVVDDLLSCSN